MPTFRKRGRRWQAMVRLAGRPPASRTFATRAEARAWAEDLEESLRRGHEGAGGRIVAAALAHYARTVAPSHRGARWEQLRLARMGLDPLATVPLDSVTAVHVADWRDRRLAQVSAGSVLREWSLLRGVFAEAVERRWIGSNPMQGVRKPASPAGRDRRISDDEIDRLRLALGWSADDIPPERPSQRIAVMLLVAIETAMRSGELCALTWENVDLDARSVRLPVTKNGTARDVPLSTRAIELLGLLGPRAGGAVFGVNDKSRDALFRKARAAAGIEGLHWHDTRHEAITRLARKLDVLDLARMVGHRDLASLRTYYNPTASEIALRLG